MRRERNTGSPSLNSPHFKSQFAVKGRRGKSKNKFFEGNKILSYTTIIYFYSTIRL